jgi:hypothetical protein
MLFVSVAKNYFTWHYTKAFSELFAVWLNFLWFIIHFFSLPQLFTALFAPWRRITESRGNLLSLEDWLGFIIINLVSRLIGATFRLTIIVCGAVSLALTIALGILIFLCWWAAPIVITASLIGGVALLANSLIT